jgi:hypothetical protein
LRQLLAAVLLVCKDEHSCQVKYRNAEEIVRKSPAWAPDFGLAKMLTEAAVLERGKVGFDERSPG